MDYEYILFDLDGTLTDSGKGIANSVLYALKKFGIEVEDRSKLYRFVGPPLLDSFERYYSCLLYTSRFAPLHVYEYRFRLRFRLRLRKNLFAFVRKCQNYHLCSFEYSCCQVLSEVGICFFVRACSGACPRKEVSSISSRRRPCI